MWSAFQVFYPISWCPSLVEHEARRALLSIPTGNWPLLPYVSWGALHLLKAFNTIHPFHPVGGITKQLGYLIPRGIHFYFADVLHDMLSSF